MTITVNFIDDTWEMNAYSLQTRAMHESHTSAHMAEVLQKAAEEWSLTEKDPVVVTDNATNMILSFAHILNLASQRTLKLPAVARLLAKILRISVFFHRSTTEYKFIVPLGTDHILLYKVLYRVFFLPSHF